MNPTILDYIFLSFLQFFIIFSLLCLQIFLLIQNISTHYKGQLFDIFFLFILIFFKKFNYW